MGKVPHNNYSVALNAFAGLVNMTKDIVSKMMNPTDTL